MRVMLLRARPACLVIIPPDVFVFIATSPREKKKWQVSLWPVTQRNESKSFNTARFLMKIIYLF